MITITVEKTNGFLDFNPAMEAIGTAAANEIKSLLRNGGSVEWNEDDECEALITTDMGNCNVEKVCNEGDAFYVYWGDRNGVTYKWDLSALLLNDLVALYEWVYTKVMEGK